MSAKDDELLKGVCHGILVGCLLPIVAYNVIEGKWKNVLMSVIYLGMLVVEGAITMNHVRMRRKNL